VLEVLREKIECQKSRDTIPLKRKFGQLLKAPQHRQHNGMRVLIVPEGLFQEGKADLNFLRIHIPNVKC
jgi:hypothetical protein